MDIVQSPDYSQSQSWKNQKPSLGCFLFKSQPFSENPLNFKAVRMSFNLRLNVYYLGE